MSAPQGVRGRNSDNTRIRQLLDWEPSIPLVEGMRQTYRWIEQEMLQHRGWMSAAEEREQYAPA